MTDINKIVTKILKSYRKRMKLSQKVCTRTLACNVATIIFLIY